MLFYVFLLLKISTAFSPPSRHDGKGQRKTQFRDTQNYPYESLKNYLRLGRHDGHCTNILEGSGPAGTEQTLPDHLQGLAGLGGCSGQGPSPQPSGGWRGVVGDCKFAIQFPNTNSIQNCHQRKDEDQSDSALLERKRLKKMN